MHRFVAAGQRGYLGGSDSNCAKAGNTNLLTEWTEIRSAAMIFEVVVGVAREPLAALGLAL
jgi:hypothetical protein